MASTRFYSDLPTHTVSIGQLMGDETRFAAMPADWRVILTDVRKSTTRSPIQPKRRST